MRNGIWARVQTRISAQGIQHMGQGNMGNSIRGEDTGVRAQVKGRMGKGTLARVHEQRHICRGASA